MIIKPHGIQTYRKCQVLYRTGIEGSITKGLQRTRNDNSVGFTEVEHMAPEMGHTFSHDDGLEVRCIVPGTVDLRLPTVIDSCSGGTFGQSHLFKRRVCFVKSIIGKGACTVYRHCKFLDVASDEHFHPQFSDIIGHHYCFGNGGIHVPGGQFQIELRPFPICIIKRNSVSAGERYLLNRHTSIECGIIRVAVGIQTHRHGNIGQLLTFEETVAPQGTYGVREHDGGDVQFAE